MLSADRRTIYEKSCCDRRAYSLPATDVPEVPLDELVPAGLRRAAPARLPEVGELDLLRHFTYLSTLNFGVESGSYPLGSCTMKYNPKINEVVSRLEGFAGLHPYQPEALVQGALELMYEFEQWLAEIAGLSRATLQPAAGCRVVRARPAISASHCSSSYMSSRAPWASASGWYGCRPAKPSSRQATSLILGLYFMVHEPSG